MRKLLSIICISALVFAACKKDPDPTPACSKTVADISGTYAITKVEANIGGGFTDVTNLAFTPCQVDNKVILNADGTSTYSDAGTKCSPDGTVSGTWSLSTDSKITISAGALSIGNADIVSFDCKTLVATGTYNLAGTPTPVKVTLTK